MVTPITGAAATASWSVVDSPNQGTSDNVLQGVGCLSSADCWAVGHYVGSVDQTLTEHYDGSGWSVVPSPNQSPNNDGVLNGISCVSSADCWAVGTHTSAGAMNNTLTEHYGGSGWSVVASPSPGAGNSFDVLSGVSCASSGDCWAVGYGTDGSLTEHYGTGGWSVVPSANPSTTGTNILSAVACLGSADCWAVGAYVNGSVDNTLIEHYVGTSWTAVSSPNQGAGNNALFGVSCLGTGDCWAAGDYHLDNTVGFQTLTEHYDGSNWSVVASPNQGTNDDLLSAVSCLSGADCWAVGHDFNGGLIEETLTEHYDGSSWSVVASPNRGTSANVLSAVTCLSTADCWAVGYDHDATAGVNQTLTEHYSVSPGPAVPDVPWVPAVGLVGAAAAFMWFRPRKLEQSGFWPKTRARDHS